MRKSGWLALLVASTLAACSLPSSGSSGGGTSPVSGTQISPAPAFSPTALTRAPTQNWPTYGGNIYNQRFADVSQITPSNVSGLKGDWRIHLRSGVGEKFSGEATPIVYDGVIYTTTGADDVFAISVDTGKVLWEYHANLYDHLSTLCCAWNNRGVAIGDGRVYLGQLDGYVVALDQQTGAVVWRSRVGRWQRGESETMAPLYYDGRIYIGLSGGEYGVRGRIYCLDASTGKELWRFYTVPGPGQPGHGTWPSDNNAWKHGGAVVWNTPAVDPRLGLLYLSTSNSGDLFNGSTRPGRNLWSASTIALNAKTGAFVWGYQQVHHDLWDYDSTNPVVLFDVTIHGQVRHAIAQANKTGWVYILDRTDGKPLLPIPEVPVPQNAFDNTWPTQPEPKGDPFVPHSIPASAIEPLDNVAPLRFRYVNHGAIFTPPSPLPPVVTPGTLGGANWPPSSYSPLTGFLYLCATHSFSLFPTVPQQFNPQSVAAGRQYLGGEFASPINGPLQGTFTAIDTRTNTVAWQRRYTTNGDNCYSGSVVTAGGVVFTGRNDGRLMAYDARTGKTLWSYETGAGANAPAVSFAWQGTQYVLQYSAGNSLVDSPRGDILTLFSLHGTLPQLPREPAGTVSGKSGT
jgi:alcohol dehydrogenase (cytochrome c)